MASIAGIHVEIHEPARSPGGDAPRGEPVLAWLRARPRRLHLPYEAADRELAERVRGLPAYYPRECELRLLDEHLPEIARLVGPGALVAATAQGIETRRLVRALDRPEGCTALALGDEAPPGATLVYLPAAPADELDPHDAVARLARLARPGVRLLLASDGTRDRAAAVAAYDDPEGLWAELARRALEHLAGSCGLAIEPGGVRALDRRVAWNELRARVEIELVARERLALRAGGDGVELAAGEPIAIGHIYKHSLHAMRGLLVAAGWQVAAVFTSRAREVRLWLCTSAARTG